MSNVDLSMFGIAPQPKRPRGRPKKAKAVDLSQFLGPKPTQTEDRPVALVYFEAQTHCTNCGETFTAPAYSGTSLFVEYRRFRLAHGWQILNRPYPVGNRGSHYIPIHSPAALPALPRLKNVVEQQVNCCPACFEHTANLQQTLPFPQELTPLERAHRAHYEGLLKQEVKDELDRLARVSRTRGLREAISRAAGLNQSLEETIRTWAQTDSGVREMIHGLWPSAADVDDE